MTDEQIALDMEDLLDSLLACKLTPKQAVGAILAALAAARQDERERIARHIDLIGCDWRDSGKNERWYTANYLCAEIRALKGQA